MTASNEVIYGLIFCSQPKFHAVCKKLNPPLFSTRNVYFVYFLLFYFYLHKCLLMFGLLCLCVFATNKDKINKYRACVTDSYLEVTVTTFQ